VKPTIFPKPLYLHRCPSDGILLALDMCAEPAASIGTAAGLPRMRSGDRQVLSDVGHRDDPMVGMR
jgi:hypothetical protein